MTYFKDCLTKEQVRARYKELAKKFHPDLGGSTEIMQKINAEYSFAIARAVNEAVKNETVTPEEAEAEILNAEAYKNALNAIINLEGLIIELCGTWLWVYGDTKPHKEILKEAGFKWCRVKVKWSFKGSEYKKTGKKTLTMEQIRAKHGSQFVNKKTAYSGNYLR